MTKNHDVRPKRRDRQVIRTEDLDEETLKAIVNAEPGDRSSEAGRRLANPVACDVQYYSQPRAQ